MSQDEIVKDVGKWEWSEMYKKEDWWAIWLGFALLLLAVIVYFPQAPQYAAKLESIEAKYQAEATKTDRFKTIGWYRMNDAKKGVQARKSDFGKFMKSLTTKPKKWSYNPIDAFIRTESQAKAIRDKATPKYEAAKAEAAAALEQAKAAEAKAEAAGFQNASFNEQAKRAIIDWRDARSAEKSAKKKATAKPYNLIPMLIGLYVFLAIFFGIGMHFMGVKFTDFLKGFAIIYALTVLSWLFSYQVTFNKYGIGYAAWAIIFGMLISNTVGTPKMAMPAVQTEYYIKTGLVLLGAKIVFEKVITIGTAGIFVAWVVTPIVWLTTYWFGQKIVKMPSKRLNAVICSDMSVCGVSAAIAAASACRAKKEELTLAVGLSLVFTAIMMVAMPAFIKAFFPADKIEVLGGAWMGGTIDATGAVAAAGAFLGEKALFVAATIKMIQNVLIGVIAFFVAIYFATKVEAEETGKSEVGLMEIWYRFPKFVIGFIAASVIFSLCFTLFNGSAEGLGATMVDQGIVKGMGDLFRKWFFTLSFVSIGLATNFRELKEHFRGGKPFILYITGQSLNICLTLLMAYIMFYLVFPDLTATI